MTTTTETPSAQTAATETPVGAIVEGLDVGVDGGHEVELVGRVEGVVRNGEGGQAGVRSRGGGARGGQGGKGPEEGRGERGRGRRGPRVRVMVPRGRNVPYREGTGGPISVVAGTWGPIGDEGVVAGMCNDPSSSVDTPVETDTVAVVHRITGNDLLEDVRGRPSRAPYVRVPAELRERLVAWRPVLGEVPGLMAVAQLLLFSSRRDDFGVAVDYRAVFRSFGYAPREGYEAGVTSGALLDLYHDEVDPTLEVLNASGDRHLARKASSFDFPSDVYRVASEALLRPDRFTDWVFLIDGRSAAPRSARTVRSEALQDRRTAASAHVPMIHPPASTRTILAYLNGLLDDQVYVHGAYGVVARLGAAREVVDRGRGRPPFDTEAKVWSALCALKQVEEHPRPIWWASDHSPRLKADPFNPLMNLPGVARRALYTDRDVELDLDRSHMAALVVIARRLGVPMPVTETVLGDAGNDLWGSIAGYMDAGALPDAGARRKAAKHVYAAVYGASDNYLMKSMLDRYAEISGTWPSGFDPFRPVLGHPVVSELLGVRDLVLDHVVDHAGLHDAEGRFVALGAMGHKEGDDSRARSVLSYVASSYEQDLVAAAFAEAAQELEGAAASGRRPAFVIWIYQADGFTVRTYGGADTGAVVSRLQGAVARRAAELGLPTRLSVAD